MKKINVGIIGLGYVGLKMLHTMSLQKNLSCFGFEKDKKKIDLIKKNKSYIEDISNQDIKKINKKNIFINTDYDQISNLDYIMICLPTPLKSKNYTPDNSFILSTFNNIYKYLKRNQTIILESTVYPGATRDIFFKRLNKKFDVGKNFFLGFSSERINPGDSGVNAPKDHEYSYVEIPKLISGVSKECLKKIKLLYSIVFKDCIECESIEIAEFSKLYENSFRFVNIGLVNELKMIADKMGIDFYKVQQAAKTKPFGFKPFFTSSGIGGHCIPVDPNFINWKAKKFKTNSKFIIAANYINESVYKWTLKKIVEESKKNKKKKIRILLIGLSYKKNVGDTRNSVPVKIFKRLSMNKKFVVSFHDKFIKSMIMPNEIKKSIKLNKINISKNDLIVITTNHDYINYKKIFVSAKIIIDTIGAYKLSNHKKIIHA
jgi:UDP-N-acetyl-D-glucosamine dehydrogenase